MPEMTAFIRAEFHAGDDHCNPLSIPILLPSAVCHDPSVPAVLLEYEFCLRKSQACDALADLQDCLEVLNYIGCPLDGNAQPVDDGLPMLASLVHAQVRLVVERYRTAYTALNELASALRKENWQGHLRRLDEHHIQCLPEDGSDTPATLQVRSWIWQLSSTLFVRSHNVGNPFISITLHHGEHHFYILIPRRTGLIADGLCSLARAVVSGLHSHDPVTHHM